MPCPSVEVQVTTTICSVGCLMSSTSMALAGKGIFINGVASDPGVLNSWLQKNNGSVRSGLPVAVCIMLGMWMRDDEAGSSVGP